jgi:ATP-dependent DNA helicase RecG
LVDYIKYFVEKKLNLVIPFAKEEIRKFSENDVVEKIIDNQSNNQAAKDNVVENTTEKRQKLILNFIRMNNKVVVQEMAKTLKFNIITIQRDFRQLQNKGIIERMGGDRGGYWLIKDISYICMLFLDSYI